MVLLLLIACRPDCPTGFVADADRAARLRTLASAPDPRVGAAPEARAVCFGEVPDLGVVKDGRFLLDAAAGDEALAARAVHLAHHLAPAPSEAADCADRLRREEARAWRDEHRVRRSLGLTTALWPASLGAEPSLAEIEGWLASPHPVARSLAKSHADRCAR